MSQSTPTPDPTRTIVHGHDSSTWDTNRHGSVPARMARWGYERNLKRAKIPEVTDQTMKSIKSIRDDRTRLLALFAASSQGDEDGTTISQAQWEFLGEALPDNTSSEFPFLVDLVKAKQNRLVISADAQTPTAPPSGGSRTNLDVLRKYNEYLELKTGTTEVATTLNQIARTRDCIYYIQYAALPDMTETLAMMSDCLGASSA